MEELFFSEKTDIRDPVQLDLEDAIAKAKEFHPTVKLIVDPFTGATCKHFSPDTYIPDEGVVNSGVDLCHIEDQISISQLYSRLKNMRSLSIQDSDFDYEDGQISADDLDDDTISDVMSEIDDPSDYDNYVNEFISDKLAEKPADKVSSVSAPVPTSADETRASDARNDANEQELS